MIDEEMRNSQRGKNKHRYLEWLKSYPEDQRIRRAFEVPSNEVREIGVLRSCSSQVIVKSGAKLGKYLVFKQGEWAFQMARSFVRSEPVELGYSMSSYCGTALNT